MWTIAALNKKFNGPLGLYNGLTDVHLAHYFSSPFRRAHLKAINLITKDGIIVPEQKVKVESLQFEKKRKIYDILANAVLQNAVHKEGTWNKRLCSHLDDVSNMEIVEKLKGHHCKGKHVKLPNSAPSSCFCLSDFGERKISSTKRRLSAKEYSPYVSPLLMSGSSKFHSQNALHRILNSKKKKKKKKKQINKVQSASKNTEFEFIADDKMAKFSVPELRINQCKITLYYYGNFPHAESYKHITQYIVIRQQHCGGTPVIVYKGSISPNETLSFISLDNDGFPFSIAVFLDGIRDLKLSACCVFRYLPGKRLGGSSGIFSLHKIEGGKPCMKCQYRKIESSYKTMKMMSKSAENIMDGRKSDAPDMMSLDFRKKESRIASVENDSITSKANEVFKREENENSDDSRVEEVEEINDSSNVCNVEIAEQSTNEESTVEVLDFTEEDAQTAEEDSYDSESSVAELSETSNKFPETKNFQDTSVASESSVDDDGGKRTQTKTNEIR